MYICAEMKIHTQIDQLPTFRNAVLTIGSFDGVHKGHQFILKKIKDLAQQINGESVVITFYPHPRQVLDGADQTFRLLSTIEEKQSLIEKVGIDHLVIIPFSASFSMKLPQEYIESFLVRCFQPSYIVIGYDHKFGKDRIGDIHYLKSNAQKFDYQVIEIEKQQIDDLTISSTKIRKALEIGDTQSAESLLGHGYLLSGVVVKGDQIGRKIGFPTANIGDINPQKLIPQNGIYAAKATIENEVVEGMMYIGHRPTIDGAVERRIEINLFDFEKDIYGQYIQLEILDKIRDDKKFDGLPALIEGLKKDEIDSKLIFEHRNKPKVAVVILNYNGQKFLEQFLPNVIQYSSADAEIIVADNCSTDTSIEFLKNHFPNIRVIQLETNNGYAGGYNESLKHIESEFYVLLNSDIEVTEHWLKPLIHCLKSNEKVAACQPKIKSYHQRDSFEYAGASGGFLDVYAYPFCRGRMFAEAEKDEGQYDDEQNIFWASGAALCIKADVFHHLGGFDDLHFAHQEEIDLCWRLQRAGFEIKVVPSSVIYHVGGGTLDYGSPFKTYLNFRNSLMMILKNETLFGLFWLIPIRLILDGVAGLTFLQKGQFKNFLNVIKAHFWVYGHIGQVIKKRNLYKNLIQKYAIGKEKLHGRTSQSIVYQYFILKKRKYSEL